VSNLNVLAREVAAKIVYYGPGLSGKTTTLKKIYESVRPSNRGEMMSLATEGDRTLFFDFLPVKVERVGDCAVRLALYTVPGQVFYNATRKLVLQGADGVVFVADSQPEALDKNREALANLEDNLAEQGIRFDRFPLVFQWNKRDISSALPVSELHEALNQRDAPEFETCAEAGKGVLESLKAITRLVIRDLRSKNVVPPAHVPTPAPHLEQGTPGLEHQVQEHLAQEPRQNPAPLAPAHVAPEPVLAARGPAGNRPRGVGSLGALAPHQLLDYARAADTAFAMGDFASCVRACAEAVRRALAFAGDPPVATQAYLLRVDGGDLLRLQQLAGHVQHRPEDAAFALYVAMQAFVRLNATSVLPTT
jgi:signal recognition particle receptor subunit beta